MLQEFIVEPRLLSVTECLAKSIITPIWFSHYLLMQRKPWTNRTFHTQLHTSTTHKHKATKAHTHTHTLLTPISSKSPGDADKGAEVGSLSYGAWTVQWSPLPLANHFPQKLLRTESSVISALLRCKSTSQTSTNYQGSYVQCKYTTRSTIYYPM